MSSGNGLIPPIDYAPPRRRRVWPALVAAALLAGGIIIGWRYGPTAYHAGVVRLVIWRAMRDVAPPGRVVFDEDPAQWPGLLARSPNYVVMNNNPADQSPAFPFVAYWVPSLKEVQEQNLFVNPFPWFYGVRRTPGGNWKLITVGPFGNGVLEGANHASGDWQVKLSLNVDVLTFGSLSRTISPPFALADRELADHANAIHQPLYLRCYAGVIDLKDDSRFSIPYQFGNLSGRIVGILKADGTVNLSAEHGVAASH